MKRAMTEPRPSCPVQSVTRLLEPENIMHSSLSQHILPNSSMMVGVCMTVISITQILGVRHGQHSIAEAFALDSVFFLVSAVLSYASMRLAVRESRSLMLEKIADVTFMVGLLFMTVAGFVLAYELF